MEAEIAITGAGMQKLTAVWPGRSRKKRKSHERRENTAGTVLQRLTAHYGDLRDGTARGETKEIPEEGTRVLGALTVFVCREYR